MAGQTTITANEELVGEFIRRVFNEHNAQATSEYFSPDVQWHGGTLGTIEGADAMTSFYGELFAALPDLHATTLGVVADEDTVWCRFVVEGTNKGSLFGFPVTEGRSGGTRSTPIASRTERSPRSGPPPT
jgi:predicted SnoaL-like aldol condensation-catalyzing enzyme